MARTIVRGYRFIETALRARLEFKGAVGAERGFEIIRQPRFGFFITPADKEISYGDPRVKAAVAMSATLPARKNTLDRAFGKIKIPVLHMTGTKDYSPIGETRPEERRVSFDNIHGADQFLLTFAEGDHMIFGGVSRELSTEKESQFKGLICESSAAFWDAYLKGDAKAKTWLTNDFKTALATNGTFEIRWVSATEKK